MPWVALVAAGVAAAGSLIAQQMANNKATDQQKAAMQQWMDLNIPDPKDQAAVLSRYQSTGQLDPRLQTAIAENPSAFGNIQQDQQAVTAQRNALQQLESIGESGGMRLQDQADLQSLMDQSASQARGNRQAISDEMAQRGQSGSGFDMASRLGNVQGQANQDAGNSLQIAAQAQNRALQAIEGAGSLGGQLEQQNFGEQAQRASAADAINRFNTQNLRDVNAANTAAQNYAQEYNLKNSQDIANLNTQTTNQEQLFNRGLLQKQFDNQAQKISGSDGHYNNLSNLALKEGDNQANFMTNVGQGVVGASTAARNRSFWDDYMKNSKDNANSVSPSSLPQSTPNLATGQHASANVSGVYGGPSQRYNMNYSGEEKLPGVYNYGGY